MAHFVFSESCYICCMISVSGSRFCSETQKKKKNPITIWKTKQTKSDEQYYSSRSYSWRFSSHLLQCYANLTIFSGRFISKHEKIQLEGCKFHDTTNISFSFAFSLKSLWCFDSASPVAVCFVGLSYASKPWGRWKPWRVQAVHKINICLIHLLAFPSLQINLFPGN